MNLRVFVSLYDCSALVPHDTTLLSYDEHWLSLPVRMFWPAGVVVRRRLSVRRIAEVAFSARGKVRAAEPIVYIGSLEIERVRKAACQHDLCEYKETDSRVLT
jgi:hypothetical protein